MSEAKRLLRLAEGIVNHGDHTVGDDSDHRVQNWPRLNAKTITHINPDGTAIVHAFEGHRHTFTKRFQCENHADDFIADWLNSLEQKRLDTDADPPQ